MPYYKDPKGNIHSLSEQDIANGGLILIPPGCVEISPEEAAALVAPSAEETAAAKAVAGRSVRNALLVIADRLINTIEDVGGTALELRSWRVDLRVWPATRGFPDISTIPSIPEGTVIPEDVQEILDQLLGN